MTSFSFGDEPAGNIATVALRTTAEIGQEMWGNESFEKRDIC